MVYKHGLEKIFGLVGNASLNFYLHKIICILQSKNQTVKKT